MRSKSKSKNCRGQFHNLWRWHGVSRDGEGMKKVRYLSSKLKAFISPLSFASLSSSPVGGAYDAVASPGSGSPDSRFRTELRGSRRAEPCPVSFYVPSPGIVSAHREQTIPVRNCLSPRERWHGASRDGEGMKKVRYLSSKLKAFISPLSFASLSSSPVGGAFDAVSSPGSGSPDSRFRTELRGSRRAEPCPVSFYVPSPGTALPIENRLSPCEIARGGYPTAKFGAGRRLPGSIVYSGGNIVFPEKIRRKGVFV